MSSIVGDYPGGNRRSSANMQVITAIYLNCRPDLRDEWLSGIEVDDVSDAQVRVSSSDTNSLLSVTLRRRKSRRCAT